jgi:anti-sigma factor RsiW
VHHVDHRAPHTDVGAYVLGVLDPLGRVAFEGHLDRCTRCRFEVRELSDVARLLAAEPRPLGRTGRRRRAPRLVAAACLAAVLGVGGWVGVEQLRAGEGTERTQQVASGERFRAVDSVNGVSGVVEVEGKSWGTRFRFQLSGVRGPLRCRLVAVTAAGAEEAVMGWRVPSAGHVADTRPPVDLDGASALSRERLERVDVRTYAGDVLLSIPV